MSVDRNHRAATFQSGLLGRLGLLGQLGLFGCLGLLTACDSSDSRSDSYRGPMVLALSWQPGFCETRPRLPECRSQISARFDASHFALHGLWPQPRSQSYCDVNAKTVALDKSRKWRRLEPLQLSKQLREELWRIMPGTRSFLHRHEWVKHGTCYSDLPEDYYADSITLMAWINTSLVKQLFARSIGTYLSAKQIRASFDHSFGKGAGDRVRVACKRDGKRTIITEITVGLSGSVADASGIGELILASAKTRPGCPGGIVDPVGLQ